MRNTALVLNTEFSRKFKLWPIPTYYAMLNGARKALAAGKTNSIENQREPNAEVDGQDAKHQKERAPQKQKTVVPRFPYKVNEKKSFLPLGNKNQTQRQQGFSPFAFSHAANTLFLYLIPRQRRRSKWREIETLVWLWTSRLAARTLSNGPLITWLIMVTLFISSTSIPTLITSFLPSLVLVSN